MEKFDIETEIDALAADTTSGSQAICLRASDIVIKAVDSLPGDMDSPERLKYIRRLMREVGHARPSMAGLYTLEAEILRALDHASDESINPSALVTKAAAGFRGKLLTSNDRIASHALNLLPDRAFIATTSRSGTVLAVLKAARGNGKLRRVLISESRPANEGMLSTAEFSEAGIPVVYTSDAALPGFIDQADAVVVGGDAFCPAGFVNKAGTYPLALSANRHGKPVIACIGTEKVVPFNIPEHYLREEPTVLWDTSRLSVQVINRVFEYTPLDLITHLVTEDGVTSGADIPEVFAKLEINPYLPNWL